MAKCDICGKAVSVQRVSVQIRKEAPGADFFGISE